MEENGRKILWKFIIFNLEGKISSMEQFAK